MIKYTGTSELLKEKGFEYNKMNKTYEYYFDNGLGGWIVMTILERNDDSNNEILMKNTTVWYDLMWELTRVISFAKQVGIENYIVEVEE